MRMTADQFVTFLRIKQGDRTAKEFAAILGVSPQYLCDVYKRRREPGESILSALDMCREVSYRKLSD